MATHFAVAEVSEVAVMSACGRPVDVALSTCDPLEVTCRVCQRSPAVRDVPVPFVVTEKELIVFRDNYKEVRAEAQAKANATGFDFGIEKDAFGFHSLMLPQKQNRYGHELRCEVVTCEDLSKVQKGHGP